MRQVFVLLVTVGLLAAALPATVAAAKPIRVSDRQTGILCELTAAAGFVSVFVDARPDGVFADVAIWSPGADPFADPPTIVTAQATAVLDLPSLTANLDLVLSSDPEKSAGSARLAAELTAASPEQDFGSRTVRDGNRQIRIEQTLQLLSVLGALTLRLSDSSEEVDLATCGASTFSSSFFSTNPNAYLTGSDQLFISCHWDTGRRAIDLLAINDEFGAFSELVIVEGEQALVGLTAPDLSETSYLASYELFDPSAGGEILGAATADAALTPSGERITEHEWIGDLRLSTVGERLATDGALTVTFGGSSEELPMDDRSCRAGDVRVRVMEKIEHG